MKLVAGLGNPGSEYEGTPHNVGFHAIDELVDRLGISDFQTKFHSKLTRFAAGGDSCILMKPQTYMNRSGLAVAECARFYKIQIEDILIISDDLDLSPGKARLRTGGGHGGHNGLKSIIESLGDHQFRRVRIGIGRPAGKKSVVGHVLGGWLEKDRELALGVLDLMMSDLISFVKKTEFKNTSYSVPELEEQKK